MPGSSVYILDATTLISAKQIAEYVNDIRVFDGLLPPGRLLITSTVVAEAAGDDNYSGDLLLRQWIAQNKRSGGLEIIPTSAFPAGPRNAGDDSIRYITGTLGDGSIVVVTDDGGLIANSGGADRVIQTGRFVVENLLNGSITLNQYINIAIGLVNQGHDDLMMFGNTYAGSNGVQIEFGPGGINIVDRLGGQHFVDPNDKFNIDDIGGIVTIPHCFPAGTPVRLAVGMRSASHIDALFHTIHRTINTKSIKTIAGMSVLKFPKQPNSFVSGPIQCFLFRPEPCEAGCDCP